jgi:uncharacterized protein YgiM (DUF1202 family)
MQLVTLFLVVSGMLLKAVARVAITMGVLWLIGVSFVYVADALGMPQSTVYELVEDFVDLLRSPWEAQIEEQGAGIATPRSTGPPPTFVEEVSFVPTPRPTLSPCQEAQRVTALLNAHVRCGPGQNNEIVNTLMRGKTAEVIGRDAYAHWWRIRHPDAPGAETWIGSTVVDFDGDVDCVPIYSQHGGNSYAQANQ